MQLFAVNAAELVCVPSANVPLAPVAGSSKSLLELFRNDWQLGSDSTC
jgi:hypothetical protein